ncbi:response regulator transcription factor [Mesorhizobium sp. LjNodule214]|uniref:response regulator transcription factor n=1 Tax=Mesorhizobium sp. LjNodule214 TaxID=3342252 RepID=UPI003ED0A795
MEPIIHIIDDDASFRTALGRIVEVSGYRANCYESGEDFLARVPESEAGCILLDLRMPGLSGPELQERLAQAVPLLPIVFLTGQGTIAASVQAMKAGADDFLEKPVSSKILRAAIERALVQNEKRRAGHDQIQVLQAKVSNLTPREIQVFDFVVRGKRNKQVAYDLNTSERTIKAHRHSIMEKLSVTSLAEMVSIAERLGRIEPTPIVPNPTPDSSPKANIQRH